MHNFGFILNKSYTWKEALSKTKGKKKLLKYIFKSFKKYKEVKLHYLDGNVFKLYFLSSYKKNVTRLKQKLGKSLWPKNFGNKAFWYNTLLSARLSFY